MTAQPLPKKEKQAVYLCRGCGNEHETPVRDCCGWHQNCGHGALCYTRDPRYLKRMEGVP